MNWKGVITKAVQLGSPDTPVCDRPCAESLNWCGGLRRALGGNRVSIRRVGRNGMRIARRELLPKHYFTTGASVSPDNGGGHEPRVTGQKSGSYGSLAAAVCNHSLVTGSAAK